MSNFILSNRTMLDLSILLDVIGDSDGPNRYVVHTLVSDILRELYTDDSPRFFSAPIGFGPEDKLYRELTDDLTRPANMAELCERTGTDKYTICKEFSETYGRTPYAFHKHIRLLEAAKTLAMDTSDMRSVAGSIGYTKEDKFAEAFRKEYGCRPKHFRESYWKSLGYKPERNGCLRSLTFIKSVLSI